MRSFLAVNAGYLCSIIYEWKEAYIGSTFFFKFYILKVLASSSLARMYISNQVKTETKKINNIKLKNTIYSHMQDSHKTW